MELEFRVWVLDDNLANLRMIERSFPEAVRAALEVRSFVDVEDFLATFDALCRTDAGRLPDFVLLDFFLGRMYGSQVLDHLLTTYRREPIPPAVIIAHSSMAQVSDSLVQAGADFALPKQKGGETSPPITEAFGSVEALRWMKRHRRPLPPACAIDDLTSPEGRFPRPSAAIPGESSGVPFFGRASDEPASGGPLTNWAGNYRYATDNLHRLTSVEGVRKFVSGHDSLKVLGTRHCFNGIADSRRVLVSLKPMDRPVELDPKRRTVTVEAGMSYGQLCPYLHARGL